MPALPLVPGVVRAEMFWTVSEDTNALTRLFFRYTGGAIDTADAVTLANSVGAAFGAHLKSLFDTTVELTSIRVTDLASASSGDVTELSAISGTLGTAPLSAGTAVLTNYTIARRYRGGKPRSYMPGLNAAQLTDGNKWATAAVTNFNNGFNAFIAEIVSTALSAATIDSHCNVSYYSGYTLGPAQPGGFRKKIPALRAAGPQVDDITNSSTNSKPGSQRRRNLHGR